MEVKIIMGIYVERKGGTGKDLVKEIIKQNIEIFGIMKEKRKREQKSSWIYNW